MPLKLTTYYQGSEIPDFPGTNTFHSKELFQIYEETPGYTPLLIMASEDGKPVARLLAAIRKSIRMFPPAFIKRCEIYGTGEYLIAEADKERIFGEMLEHLTTEALRNSFLIEFRNLENAMFGYKYFRSNRYFPCQLAAGTKLASRHRKRRTAFQPLPYPPDQKRPEKRSKSRRGTYGRRDTRIFEYAEASLFVPHP